MRTSLNLSQANRQTVRQTKISTCVYTHVATHSSGVAARRLRPRMVATRSIFSAQGLFLKLRFEWLQELPKVRANTALVEGIPKEYRRLPPNGCPRAFRSITCDTCDRIGSQDNRQASAVEDGPLCVRVAQLAPAHPTRSSSGLGQFTHCNIPHVL